MNAKPRTRVIHRAGKIRNDGAVAAICSNPPRPINMRTATWTTTGQPTCKKCLALLAREAKEAK